MCAAKVGVSELALSASGAAHRLTVSHLASAPIAPPLAHGTLGMRTRPHRGFAGTSSHATTAREDSEGSASSRRAECQRQSWPRVRPSAARSALTPGPAGGASCSLASSSSTHTRTPSRPGATAREAHQLKRGLPSRCSRAVAHARARACVCTRPRHPPARTANDRVLARPLARALCERHLRWAMPCARACEGCSRRRGGGGDKGRGGRPRDDDDHGRFRFRWWVCLRGGG